PHGGQLPRHPPPDLFPRSLWSQAGRVSHGRAHRRRGHLPAVLPRHPGRARRGRSRRPEGPSAGRSLSRLRALLVGLCLAASAMQSFFFAWALAPDSEEEMYMYLGKLALTGHISLFQDDLTGNRMPLPYYVLALSQLVWPRILLAARFVSASLGLICLVLVWRIASLLAGEVAGILALL